MMIAKMKSMKFATLLCLIPLQLAIGCYALPKFSTRNQAQTPNDNRVQLVTQCQTKCEVRNWVIVFIFYSFLHIKHTV